VILLLNPLAAFFGRLPGVQQQNDPEWAFAWLKRNGAKAAIIIPTSSPYGGGSEHLVDSWEKCRSLFPFLVVEVGISDGGKLVNIVTSQGNGNLTVTVEPGDFNMWRYIRRGWFLVVFSIVSSLTGLVITSLALAKLIAYIRIFGFELSIAQTSLAIHAVVNMYRLIYSAVDPLYAGRYLDGFAAHSLPTLTWPFPIITTLLISLYLRELLSKMTMKGNVRIANFLTNMRIPFIIISIVLLGLEVATSALRATRASTLNVLTFIVAAAYFICASSMAVFFIVTGSRVVGQQLRAAALRNGSTSDAVKGKPRKSKVRWSFKAVKYILVAAGFLLLFCLSLIGLAITVRCSLTISVPAKIMSHSECPLQPLFYHPIGHYTVWTMVWVSLYGISFAQIAAFKTPSIYDSRSKMSSKVNSRLSSRAGSASLK
jgi:hypothetical protein